jgi:hypothetical protein
MIHHVDVMSNAKRPPLDRRADSSRGGRRREEAGDQALSLESVNAQRGSGGAGRFKK